MGQWVHLGFGEHVIALDWNGYDHAFTHITNNALSKKQQQEARMRVAWGWGHQSWKFWR